MLQYRDGTFSGDMSADEAFEKFQEYAPLGEAKALHIGTRAELQKVRDEADKQTQIDDLKDRLSSLESKEPLNSDLVHLPTNEDVLRFAPKDIKDGA